MLYQPLPITGRAYTILHPFIKQAAYLCFIGTCGSIKIYSLGSFHLAPVENTLLLFAWAALLSESRSAVTQILTPCLKVKGGCGVHLKLTPRQLQQWGLNIALFLPHILHTVSLLYLGVSIFVDCLNHTLQTQLD